MTISLAFEVGKSTEFERVWIEDKLHVIITPETDIFQSHKDLSLPIFTKENFSSKQ